MALLISKGMGLASIPLEEVTDPGDPIVKVLADAKAGAIGLVAAADKIDEIAMASGLCSVMKINPRLVGVDITNRGGQGVSVLEVALLAGEIVQDGWSWQMTSHATCIEERPGAGVIQDFNEKLVAGTDLAPVQPDSIRYGSLSCGHTNQILRAMGASQPATIPHATEHGRYCMGRIRSRDANLAEAVGTGLQWKVYSWRARVWYPTLPDLLGSARGMAASTLRKQGEMEGLLKLHTSSVSTQGLAADGAPAWHIAKADLMKTRPPFADKVDAMIGFVATKSGGAEGEHLRYLNRWHNNFVKPSQRAGVPGALYTALASCPCQYLSFAILEAAWSCPRGSVQNLECRWVTAGDVGLVTKGAEAKGPSTVHAAELVLADARARLGAGGPKKLQESNALVQVFGRFDIHVARYVMDKQEATQAVVFKNLREICRSFVLEIQKTKEGASFASEGFGEKTLAGIDVEEGAATQPSKNLVKAQALHAKASSSTSKQASLPLAQIDEGGGSHRPFGCFGRKDMTSGQ